VKAVRDQAEAIKNLLRERGEAHSLYLDAAEIKVRAGRKIGEMLAKTVRHQGGRPKKHAHRERVLPEGVDHNESRRWQMVATVPPKKVGMGPINIAEQLHQLMRLLPGSPGLRPPRCWT
jgi:hypothetical protein